MNLKKCFYVPDDLFFSKMYPDNCPRGKSPPSLNYPRTITKSINIFFFAIKIDIFKICFKSLVFPKYNAVILRFEIVSDLNFECNTKFYRLDLVASFSIYQNMSVMNFPFTNFFFFLTATNVLATS